MKRKLLGKFLFGVMALSLSAALCACGGGKTGGSSAAANNSSEETADSGVFTFGLDSTIASVDPHVDTDAATRSVLFNVFEGLVKPAPDGSVTEAVAQSYEMSDDATTYTFTLRDGITFQDGNAVKASDVKYSLERSAEIDGESSALSVISDISCPDDATVVITLAEPNTEFIYNLSTSVLEEANDANQGTTPIGTGPFKVTEYKEGEYISFERYADYWNKDLDCIDKAMIKFYDKADTAYTELKAGAIDAMWQMTPDQVADLGDGFNTVESSMKLVQGLFLNNSYEPLSKPEVRQALNYAINRQEVDDFLLGGGSAKIATYGYPTITEWYNKDTEGAYAYDEAKAKELLTQGGYPDGFDLEITVPNNYTLHVQAAEVMKDELAKVGVNVTVNPVDWSTWISDVYQGRKYQATVIGFDISSLAPSTWYVRYVSDSANNMTNFNNAEYDQVYAKAKAATDPAEKKEAYFQLQQILTDDAASVFMMDPLNLVVLKKGYTGFASYPIYVIDLSSVKYE